MTEATSSRRMVATLVFLIFGPICWALQLTAMYGGQSALCAFGVDAGVVTFWVLGVSILAGLACAVGLVWAGPIYAAMAGEKSNDQQWQFLAYVMRALSALSLLAIAYAAVGSIILPSCGALR